MVTLRPGASAGSGPEGYGGGREGMGDDRSGPAGSVPDTPGPAMINVVAVRVDQPGVTVRSSETERQFAPGVTAPIDVVVQWNCVADQPNALVASVTVETEDEQVRNISPVKLDGTSWIDSGVPVAPARADSVAPGPAIDRGRPTNRINAGGHGP